MKKVLLFGWPLLALAACNGYVPGTSIPTAPSVVADKTVLDEKAAISVELAYTAWGLAVSASVDAGLLKGERAAKVGEVDRVAYNAVRAARYAYDTGNASTYGQAITNANNAIAAAMLVLKGQ